jgi:RNA polymerase sigma-70 factor, ECF subfamily
LLRLHAVPTNAYELILTAAPQLTRAASEHEQLLMSQYLADRFSSAQRACPGIVVAPQRFWPYVAARLPPAKRTLDTLAELHFNDLYLACACQSGDRAALKLIEKRHLPKAFRDIDRLRLDQTRADGLRRVLRQQILVVDKGRAPGITAYRGHEPLVAWLRKLVERAALEILAKDRRAAR